MSDNNDVPELTPHILMQIRDELRVHSEQFVALRTDLKQGLADVNLRIDNLILAAGAGRGDHERRITRLERRVDGLESEPKTK